MLSWNFCCFESRSRFFYCNLGSVVLWRTSCRCFIHYTALRDVVYLEPRIEICQSYSKNSRVSHMIYDVLSGWSESEVLVCSQEAWRRVVVVVSGTWQDRSSSAQLSHTVRLQWKCFLLLFCKMQLLMGKHICVKTAHSQVWSRCNWIRTGFIFFNLVKGKEAILLHRFCDFRLPIRQSKLLPYV